MLEIRDLRLIAALAAHGSLVRVARLQGVSQPTLTRALSGLESRLGTTLFDRSRRGMVPTDVCRAILAQSTDVLAGIEAMNASIAELRGAHSAVLRIATAPYPLETLLVPAAAQFVSEHPDTQLRIEACNALDAVRLLHQRHVDLTFADISELDVLDQLTVTPLLRHPIFLLARPGHPLTAPGRSISLGDILAYPLAATSYFTTRIALPVGEARQRARLASAHAAFPSIVLEPLASCLAIAARSDVVAAATLPAAAAALQSGQLQVIAWHEPWLTVNFGIIALRHRPQPATAAELVRLALAADEAAFAEAQAMLPELIAGLPGRRAIPGTRLQPAGNE